MSSAPQNHSSRQSDGSSPAHGRGIRPTDDAPQIATPFADLFSQMPDAKPGDVDTIVANIREDLQSLRLPEASFDDIQLNAEPSAAPRIRKPVPPAARRERLPLPANELVVPRPINFIAPAVKAAPQPNHEPEVTRQPLVARPQSQPEPKSATLPEAKRMPDPAPQSETVVEPAAAVETQDLFGDLIGESDPFGEALLKRRARATAVAAPAAKAAAENRSLPAPVAPLLAKIENRDVERIAERAAPLQSQYRNDQNQSDESADESAPPSLSEQIMEHLEKSNIAAISRLRIEVKNGDVIVSGEVPSSHERHLVAHYCKQHPDVTTFVDKMVVMRKKKGAQEAKPAPGQPAVQKFPPKPKAVRHRRAWRLQFSLTHAVVAIGVGVLGWGAVSLGLGRGSPDRIAVYPLTGEFRFDGQPANGAWITLHPVNPAVPTKPKATVEPDGTFAVMTYLAGDGAPAGTYKVTIEWRRPIDGQTGDEEIPPNVLPPNYANLATTPLEVTVKSGKNTFPAITIQL
jgi:hypothetical protein